jgi:PAS domain S-box-containing protein
LTAIQPAVVLFSFSGASVVLLLLLLSLIAGIIFIILLSRKLDSAKKDIFSKDKQINDLESDLRKLKDNPVKEFEIISKEHSDSDLFYEMLVQSASDGIAFYDNEMSLKFANSAFYNLLGIDEKKNGSVHYNDLVHPDDLSRLSERTSHLREKGVFECEFRLRHGKGHYISFSCRSVSVKNKGGENLGALSIIRDISKISQAQEDLLKAKFEADSSNRLKASFLANISHEIRTPLNSVVGFSNLLLSDNLTKEAREEYIEHINHNSEKLLQIIGDIIDLSRLESSQIEITYEETSLSSIVNEIIEDARQVIKRNEKPIILNVKNEFHDNGDLIFTDRVWLKRVLNHLMDNAVKFTLDGSIELYYFLENGKIVFRIKDTGIGINKENLVRIFEEFRQEVDGHHRPFEGLGIGLTLAREVVTRMGGEIFVQSEKGIGSEFSFSLPFRPAGSTKISRLKLKNDEFLKPIDWSSKKCLLVDDNKDVLIYLNRILVDTGVTILTARSGSEALELIRNTPDIDVVLLDMQMPEMNGIEATKEIRKIRKDLPIIAQTAFVFEDDKDIIIEAGCDACLIKPIRKDHLLTVMSSFVKSN